jgi:putative DNA primase/helicase
MVDAEPYPLDQFPPLAAQAIREYQSFGQQPLAMVASACLAQMALAAQGLADVGRDEMLISPLSLNILILGQSGERKTGIDSAMAKWAKQWEAEKKELLLPEYRKSKAMEKAWRARMDGVKQRLKAIAHKENDADVKESQRLQDRLIELEQNPIQVAPLPQLFYEDATPQGLAYSLATGWPSAALVSDEAGIVVGGAGMGEDAALGFLTLLNRLWDAREYKPTRRSVETAELRGRRFSAALMLQAELLEKIIDRGGRGVGFFGRYLLTAPVSTMGQRFYQAPPAAMPSLSAFGQRIKGLLDAELPTNEAGELEPPVMLATPEAREIWRGYHDAIEAELSPFGEFAAVRDVAAKSAENAARIAGVFQVFAQDAGAKLKPEYMRAGVAVAAWHLAEANRIFFAADKPEEIQDAELLSAWLCSEAPKLTDSHDKPLFDDNAMLPVRAILQYGPYRLRTKQRRDSALQVLAEPGVEHVRITKIGRRELLSVNPKLLNI